LLPVAAKSQYVRFVARAFRWRHDARTLGVDQWAELFRAFDRRNPEG